MPESPNRVLVVTADQALFDGLARGADGRGLEMVRVPALREAAACLRGDACAAVVIDFGTVPTQDRPSCRALRGKNSKTALFFLETNQSISPAVAAAMRSLAWPLPRGFADQVRATDRPVLILADQTLFTTAALQSVLQQAGVQVVSLESTKGLAEFMAEQKQARAKESAKPRGFWSGLMGSDEEPAMPALARVVVASFAGSLDQADELCGNVREAVPEAACYYVSSMDAARAAALAIKEGQPVSLMRESAERLLGFLAGERAMTSARPQEKERILLVDNFKPALAALGQALLSTGYEVVTASEGEEALRVFRPGAFSLAVIGTAITCAQRSGSELAQRMRELDPDLRIIFLVDRYPLQSALQGVSQVVELGLDDALLKPIEASRLLFSVQRALERRFLLRENARLLKELQESNRQLAQINDFQKKFFAMVAHDVKNPLTAILGYAEVLGMRLKDRPNETRCASHIHSAAKTLNLLISDLVDLAAIESGKLRVEICPLDLFAVVAEVRARIEIVAAQRKIHFAVELPSALPPLAGDPARLGQVIQNLCTNAVQYTKEGGTVTIRVEAFADKVVVSVIDTGIGIAAQDLPRIWERFFQTDEAKKMRKAGFGLGLKIAREIVQMHGGEMGIESQLGVGSRFYFYLPVSAPAARPA